MKKIILLILGIIALTSIAHAVTVFNSNQVGTNPQANYYLQTNGTTSTWATVAGASSTNVFGILPIVSNQVGTNATITFNTSTPLTWGAIQTFASGTITSATATFNGKVLDASGNAYVTSTAAGTGTITTSSVVSVNNYPFWTSGSALSGTSTLTVSAGVLSQSSGFNILGLASTTQLRSPSGTINVLYVSQLYDSGATSTQCETADPITGLISAGNCVVSLNNLNGNVIATGTAGQIKVASGTGQLVFSFVTSSISQFVNDSGYVTSTSAGSVSTSSAITVNNYPFWTSAGGALSGTSTLTVSGLNLFAASAFNASGTISQNGVAVGFGTLGTSTGLTTNAIPLITAYNTLGNSQLAQSAGGITNNGSQIIDGGGNYTANVIQTNVANVVQAVSLVWGGTTSNVVSFNTTSTIASSSFCGANYGVAQNTTGSITLTFPGLAAINQASCAGTFPQQSFTIFADNSTNSVAFAAGASETIYYAPGTPSVMSPGDIYTQDGGYATSTNGQLSFSFRFTKFTSSTITNALVLAGANGGYSAYAGAAGCSAGQAVTTISAQGTTTCAVFGSGSGTLTTSTANTAGQLAIGDGGSAIRFSSSFTATTSTGVLAAPTGTFSGTLAVGTTTQNGTLNVNGTVNVSATTTFGTGNTVFTSNPTNFKAYIGMGNNSSVSATVGGTWTFSATSTGNGAGASTTIETTTVPTSTTMVIGDEWDIYMGGTIANSAATNKQLQLNVSGTQIFASPATALYFPASAATSWWLHAACMVQSTTSSMVCSGALEAASGTLPFNTTVSNLNYATGTIITLYGNGTNASDTIANFARYYYNPY